MSDNDHEPPADDPEPVEGEAADIDTVAEAMRLRGLVLREGDRWVMTDKGRETLAMIERSGSSVQ